MGDLSIMEDIKDLIEELVAAGHTREDLCLLYARVSTEKQAERGNSKEDQEHRARDYCEREGLVPVRVYSASESAWKEGRPEFNKMIDDSLEYGIKHLVFKNTDRMGRNDADLARIKKLAKAGKFTLHLYELGVAFGIDSTAEDEMFLDSTGIYAKYWSNKISQSVKSAYKDRAHHRRVPFKLPLGYTWNATTRRPEIDPKTEPIVRKMFELYDVENLSTEEVAVRLNALGYKGAAGKPFHGSTVQRILINPIYCGTFIFHGQEYEGEYPIYLDRAAFEARRAKVQAKYYGARKGEREFLLSKFIKCDGCGRIFSGMIANRTRKNNYIAYVHKCSALDNGKVYLREDELLPTLKAEILDMFATSTSRAHARKELLAALAGIEEKAAGRKGEIGKAIDALERKKARAADLYIDGEVDNKQEVITRLNELTRQIQGLRQQEAGLEEVRSVNVKEVEKVIDQVFDLKERTMEGKEFVGLLRHMARGVKVGTDHAVLGLEWLPVFNALLVKDMMGDLPEIEPTHAGDEGLYHLRCRFEITRKALEAILLGARDSRTYPTSPLKGERSLTSLHLETLT